MGHGAHERRFVHGHGDAARAADERAVAPRVLVDRALVEGPRRGDDARARGVRVALGPRAREAVLAPALVDVDAERAPRARSSFQRAPLAAAFSARDRLTPGGSKAVSAKATPSKGLAPPNDARDSSALAVGAREMGPPFRSMVSMPPTQSAARSFVDMRRSARRRSTTLMAKALARPMSNHARWWIMRQKRWRMHGAVWSVRGRRS